MSDLGIEGRVRVRVRYVRFSREWRSLGIETVRVRLDMFFDTNSILRVRVEYVRFFENGDLWVSNPVRAGVRFAFCSLCFSFTEYIHAASFSMW